ncbi:MAG TPA: S53 family peptidase [Jatrophihabitans sp.]|nr:S53 family peptidase [Jatrophihabitans sp.]
MTNETPSTPSSSDPAAGTGTGSPLDQLQLVPLPGSERAPAPEAQPAVEPQALDPNREISVTVVLRRRAAVPDEALTTPMPREEFLARYGADPDEVRQVTETLTGLGARVEDADPGSRRVRVTGPTGLLARIFGATDLTLRTSASPAGGQVRHRHRTGGLSVPADLAGIIVAVLGLDDRPQSRAQFRFINPQATTASYTPPQLGTVYNFPPGTDGSGQTVAIIELGGGFEQSDLDTYFSSIGVASPTVTAVGVDGATNQPGQDPQGADGEVLLDIEVVGGLAPGADIVVYFAPNTDAGFVDAVSQAAHADPAPAAMSISWGQSEDQWTAQARNAFDQALTDAAALGVTVTVAAGDDGSTDRQADGKSHVDFPAASPHALACGGTRLQADPATGRVSAETVWNNGAGNGATGGGVSATFPRPSYQQHIGVPGGTGSGGRGVPDVAGDADPQTGYRVRVDGTDTVIGGTSAVAPLWAALIARLAQATGRRFGLIQPLLYGATGAGQVPPGFRDVTQGNNGAYQAGPGWDACTGLGVPDGSALLSALHGGQPGA